jgi:hypothetical protein
LILASFEPSMVMSKPRPSADASKSYVAQSYSHAIAASLVKRTRFSHA